MTLLASGRLKNGGTTDTLVPGSQANGGEDWVLGGRCKVPLAVLRFHQSRSVLKGTRNEFVIRPWLSSAGEIECFACDALTPQTIVPQRRTFILLNCIDITLKSRLRAFRNNLPAYLTPRYLDFS